jgi:hypothetical protein
MGAASSVALGFARILHEMFKMPVEVLHAGHLELPPYFLSGQVDDLEKSILEAAQKVEPDLIVMGAEQKSGVLEGLFSSSTERVMQPAKAPLLIVPKL